MSPRTKEQFEALREEKKSMIMDAALEHFARDGYHNTTISHLAKHAGMSKGLMYNYFRSKEELLSAIINKSISEIASYFDPDRDGILTPDEFELFVRKYFAVINDKVVFWRLFFQLMLQKDVREQMLLAYSGTPGTGMFNNKNYYTGFKSGFLKVILDYFKRKAKSGSAGSDPVLEMNMFIYTISGLALMTIYSERINEADQEKTISRIIELYK